MESTQGHNQLARKLAFFSPLTDEDQKRITSLCQRQLHVRANRDLAAEGETPQALFAVMQGWAIRHRALANGKRQIISVLVPGDMTEPFGVLPKVMSHSITAQTDLVVSPISVPSIRLAASASRALADALWHDLLATQAASYERIVTLGCRSAVERIGHWFCELHYRLMAVGLVTEDGFEMPLTQADLGEILGISAVHVNRSLQEMRALDLIRLQKGRLQIRDIDALATASDFTPTYFHTGEMVGDRLTSGVLSA